MCIGVLLACMYTCMLYPQRPEEGDTSLRAEITNGC